MIDWLTKSALPVMRQTAKEWGEDDGARVAAAVAYFASLALMPLLLLVIASLGFLLRVSPSVQDVQAQLVELVARSTSPSLSLQLKTILDQVEMRAAIGGPLGLVTLLIGAFGIFIQLDSAFDRLWDLPRRNSPGLIASIRRVLHGRLYAFVILVVLGLVVVVLFVLGMIFSAVASYAEHLPSARSGWRIVQTVITIVINALVFGILYRFLPKTRMRWRDIWPAAIWTAVVWEVGRQLLALLLVGQRYDAYGVVGAFIAMMAWVYFASLVFFFGAEMVQVICRRRERQEQDGEDRPDTYTVPVPGRIRRAKPGIATRIAYATGGAVVGILSVLATVLIGIWVGLSHFFRRD